MEQMDFGAGFAAILYAIFFIEVVLKLTVTILIIFVLSKYLEPRLSKYLNFKIEHLTKNNFVNFFSFQLSFFIITPIIFMLANIVEWHFHPIFEMNTIFFRASDILTYGDIYLLSLTFWQFSINLNNFKLKGIKKIILQSFTFILLGFLCITLAWFMQASQYSSFNQLLIEIIDSLAFGLLTIFYIKRNQSKNKNIT